MEPETVAAYLQRHYGHVSPRTLRERCPQFQERKQRIAMYAELRLLPAVEQDALIAFITDLCNEATMRPGQALELLYKLKHCQHAEGETA